MKLSVVKIFWKLCRTVSIQAMLFFNLTLDGGSSSSNNKIAIIMTANTYSSVCSMQESRHSTYINSFDPLSLLGICCYYP